MKLSIIMPVYKGEKYIINHLTELLSFDFSDIELIVVVCEDGNDSSATLCEGFQKKYQNTKVIVQKDMGLSAARNTGLEAATGEYVFFMDSDDKILEPGFQDLLNIAESDVIVCKYVLLQSNGKIRKPAYNFPKTSTTDGARKIIYSKLPDSIWNAWRYVCKRDFLLRNCLYFVPGLISEDMEWTPRMLDKAESIAFYDTPFYGYSYNHPQQLSKRVSPKRTVDVNKTVVKGLKEFSPLLRDRLIRESLFSVSDYCKFGAKDRKTVKPYILEAEKHYGLATSKKARFYRQSRKFIPLYCWSVVLCAAKAIRGKLKFALGPNKV